MKPYELMVLTRADLTEEERGAIVARVEDWLKELGTEIIKSKYLGNRKLAYPIKKLEEAAYNLWFLKGPPEMPGELAAKVRIDEAILRYLLIERHADAIEEIRSGTEG